MTRFRKLAVLVVATLFGVGLSAISAQAAVRPALPLALQSLYELGVITDGQEFESEATLSDALVIVTPGTDDTSLIERVSPLVGSRPAVSIVYDEAFGPIIVGKSGAVRANDAPTFTESKAQAVAGNIAVMQALDNYQGPVFYTGYSQGAVALGDAAEIASKDGLLGEHDEVYLTSDGRAPWSIMPRIEKVLPPEVSAADFGVPLDGARDPADAGDVHVTQVVVTADTVANFQWKNERPVESTVVNMLGFAGCHADPSCYGDLAQHGEPELYESIEGNTTYEVYDSLHPATMVGTQVLDAVGIGYSEQDVARWDAQAESWFGIEMPTPDNAAVGMRIVSG